MPLQLPGHTNASLDSFPFFSQLAEANIITLVSTARAETTVKLPV